MYAFRSMQMAGDGLLELQSQQTSSEASYLVAEALAGFAVSYPGPVTSRAAAFTPAAMAVTFGQTRTCFAAATAPVAGRAGKKVCNPDDLKGLTRTRQ